MKDLSAGLAAVFGVIVIVFGMVAYNTFTWAFVAYKFWYWFLLPVFPTLPIITYWQSMGIFLFISLFKSTSSSTDRPKEQYREEPNYTGFFTNPWLTLFFGYLIYLIIK